MGVTQTAHSTYSLKYHIVWVCKYRRRILKPGMCKYLEKLLPKLLRSMPGVKIGQVGFNEDHLHMVMVVPLKYSIFILMGEFKSQSASPMRKSFR